MPDPVRACIGLGANLGDRAANIDRALALLRDAEGVSLLAAATPVRTAPVTRTPGEKQPEYLNSAAVVQTTLPARELLDVLLSIELALGRDRAAEERWGPRLIDLDLLLYADHIIDEPGLTVPHPEMHKRAFVLEPLAEIAPDLRHPALGRTIVMMYKDLCEDSWPWRQCLCVVLATVSLWAGDLLGRAQAQPDESPRAVVRQMMGDPSQVNFYGSVVVTVERGGEETVSHGRMNLMAGVSVWLELEGVGLKVDGSGYRIWTGASDGRVVQKDSLAAGSPHQQIQEDLREALSLLPPLPIPHFRCILGDNALSSLPPLWASVEWVAAGEVDGSSQVTGQAEAGTVSLRESDFSGIVEVQFVSELPGDDTIVTIQTRPVSGMLLQFPRDLNDRRPVRSIRDLVPTAGILRPDDPLAGLVLLDSQSVPWFGPAGAPALLVFLRESDAWSGEVRTLMHRLVGSPELGPLAVHPVLVLAESDGDLAARVAERIDEWGGNLLWTVSAQSSIDLFAPDATAVAVALDPAGVVADLCIIENRASDVESLARRFTEALSQ